MIFDLFKFQKKTKLVNKAFEFSRDLHAHIIPEVDDGPRTMEESISLIKGMKRLGSNRITATSHIYQAYYPNTKKELIDAFAKLKNEIAIRELNVELDLAAEYFLDENFEKLLETNELLPIADKYLLIEISFLAAPEKLYDSIFRIQTKGYRPILAHPERYLYFESKDYEKLLDFGCQFQANLLSFLGFYGSRVKRRAFKLLNNGWINVLGSDLHNNKQLDFLAESMEEQKLNFLSDHKWLNEFI